MTSTEARTAVKLRLGITDTSFDDEIDDFVDQAINRLWPFAQKESVTTYTISTNDHGESSEAVSTLGLDVVSRVQVRSSNDQPYRDVEFEQAGDNVYMYDVSTDETAARFFGTLRYTITTLDAQYELPIFWYAISEFYDLLARDKSKYNIYMSNGARQVDNVREMAEYYEAKASAHLADHYEPVGIA